MVHARAAIGTQSQHITSRPRIANQGEWNLASAHGQKLVGRGRMDRIPVKLKLHTGVNAGSRGAASHSRFLPRAAPDEV
jgi:hypothetical protein